MKIGTGIVAAHTSSLESATASLYCEGPDLPVCSCPYCSGKELLVAHLLTQALPQSANAPHSVATWNRFALKATRIPWTPTQLRN